MQPMQHSFVQQSQHSWSGDCVMICVSDASTRHYTHTFKAGTDTDSDSRYWSCTYEWTLYLFKEDRCYAAIQGAFEAKVNRESQPCTAG